MNWFSYINEMYLSQSSFLGPLLYALTKHDAVTDLV